MYRNLGEFLEKDHNWAFRDLFLSEGGEDPENRKRVFVALEWYARSSRDTVTESEALLSLAIALESLLGVPEKDAVRERLKAAILTLLGPVPRLGDWVDQFYNTRSEIVHEGVPSELAFLIGAKEQQQKPQKKATSSIAHRPLLEYGRGVFRLCLASILSGAALAHRAKLAHLLVNNRERLTNICKTLSNTSLLPEKRLLEACEDMADLKEFEMAGVLRGVELKPLLGTARCVLRGFTEAFPDINAEATALMNELAAGKGSTDRENLTLLKRLLEILCGELQAPCSDDNRRRINSAICDFLSYATDPRFFILCSSWDGQGRQTEE